MSETTRKFCKDCDHHEQLRGHHFCHGHVRTHVNLVTGPWIELTVCQDARRSVVGEPNSGAGVCGPDGKLFVPRRAWWVRVLSWVNPFRSQHSA